MRRNTSSGCFDDGRDPDGELADQTCEGCEGCEGYMVRKQIQDEESDAFGGPLPYDDLFDDPYRRGDLCDGHSQV